MTIGLVALIVSVAIRAGAPDDRTIPIVISIAALLVVTAGAFVGGDVVYVFGNMVSRHAFRGAGAKWIALDTGDVADLAELPEATPHKMRAGINDLVVIRVGDDRARHAQRVRARRRAARQGHGRRLAASSARGMPRASDLDDGRVVHGPSVYDQPSYEIRAAEGGGYEVRRAPVS